MEPAANAAEWGAKGSKGKIDGAVAAAIEVCAAQMGRPRIAAMKKDSPFMSMSMYVVGIMPPNQRYLEMKAIWDSCVQADIPVPEGVEEYFHGEDPDDTGIRIDISSSEWQSDCDGGLEVQVKDIPPGVETIRFVCSY